MKKLLVGALVAGLVLPTPSALALDPTHGGAAAAQAVDTKLAQIEKRDAAVVSESFATAEVARAEKAVTAAQKDVEARTAQIADLDAAIAKKTASLDTLGTPAERDEVAAAVKELAQAKSVEGTRLEIAKNGLAAAQKELEIAKQHLAIAKEELKNAKTPEDKKKAEDKVKEAQNNVTKAQNKVTKTPAKVSTKKGTKTLPKTSAVK